MNNIIEFVQQEIYDNFQAGNIEGVMNAFSDDMVFVHQGPSDRIPFGGVWSGKARVGEMFQAFGGSVEPVFVDIKSIVANEDTVIVLARESYRVRATQKAYETEVAHVWTIRDGKAVNCLELYDSAAVADAFAA